MSINKQIHFKAYNEQIDLKDMYDSQELLH